MTVVQTCALPILDLGVDLGIQASGGVLLDFLGFQAKIPDKDPWVFFDLRYNLWRAVFGWPKSPGNLRTNNITSSSISIDWEDRSNIESGYEIFRKIAGGDYTKIANVGPNTTAYTNAGLSPGAKYTYKVRAYSVSAPDGGIWIPSFWSNETTGTVEIGRAHV